MATKPQRVQATLNAIFNTTATLSQVNRAGTAIADAEGKLAEYTAGDNEAKARIVLDYFRRLIVDAVQSYESQAALKAAADEVSNNVTNDFKEQP